MKMADGFTLILIDDAGDDDDDDDDDDDMCSVQECLKYDGLEFGMMD